MGEAVRLPCWIIGPLAGSIALYGAIGVMWLHRCEAEEGLSNAHAGAPSGLGAPAWEALGARVRALAHQVFVIMHRNRKARFFPNKVDDFLDRAGGRGAQFALLGVEGQAFQNLN